MKAAIITLTFLVLLTLLSVMISNSEIEYSVLILLSLASLKFLGIAFYFMEIRKAHLFWKVAILSYVLLFTGIIAIFMYI